MAHIVTIMLLLTLAQNTYSDSVYEA